MTTVLDHNLARSENIRSRFVQFVGANEATAVVVLTVAGGALRLFHLGYQSLWLDELFSYFLARRGWADIVAGTARDTMPPLYYFLLHLALQFGTDEATIRFVSLVFGVVTIPLLYAFARLLFDRRTAMAATAIFSFSPFQVSYAQEARMYSQLAFFGLVALYGFVGAWREGRFRDWALFVAGTELALYTHNLAIFLLAAVDLFAVLQWKAWRARGRGLILSNAAVLVLFAPWLVVLPQQVQGVYSSFWNAFLTPIDVIAAPAQLVYRNFLPDLALPFGLFGVIGLLAFGVASAVRAIRGSSGESWGLRLSIIVFLVPPILLCAASLLRPIWVLRTLIPASFGLYLLLGWAVVNARPRTLSVVFGVIMALGMLVGLANHYSNPKVQNPGTRQAAQALAASYHEGDAVAHTNDSTALAFMYYEPSLPNQFLEGDPDYENHTSRGRSGEIAGLVPKDWDTLTAWHNRLWLVVALDHNEDYQQAQVDEAARRFSPGIAQRVNGIYLILFTKP